MQAESSLISHVMWWKINVSAPHLVVFKGHDELNSNGLFEQYSSLSPGVSLHVKSFPCRYEGLDQGCWKETVQTICAHFRTERRKYRA